MAISKRNKSAKPTTTAAKRTARPPAPRTGKPKPAARPAKSKPAVARTPAKPVEVPLRPASRPRGARFSDKDLNLFRKELLALRDRLTGQVARMRQDSLKRDDEVNPEEDGTDAFDRLFALERVGTDQDRIFTIDEAIRAINEGTYGACESCGNLIEKPRLHALPFAKNCIKCQSEMERARNGSGGRRQIP